VSFRFCGRTMVVCVACNVLEARTMCWLVKFGLEQCGLVKLCSCEIFVFEFVVYLMEKCLFVMWENDLAEKDLVKISLCCYLRNDLGRNCIWASFGVTPS